MIILDKTKVTDIMLELWSNVDQAGFDKYIIEGFENSSKEWQIGFIKSMLDTGFDRARIQHLSDEDREYVLTVIKKACKLTNENFENIYGI